MAHIQDHVGVASGPILNMVQALEDLEIPMHSLQIAHQGHLVYEAYWAPFHKETLHRMFSISKSFTALAIGVLLKNGSLRLEDPIVDYFPEYTLKPVHPYQAQMTIRDLLTMQTCYKETTFKSNMDTNWVESFFITNPSHQPGTFFNYDTSASHTLCALVEKLTHQPLLDFLRAAFLDAIGFSQTAYMMKDPFGVSMGGSGLMALPSDIMKVNLYIRSLLKGELEGPIDSSFLKEATSLQSHTLIKGPITEERQGYGYQFWLIKEGGFAMYGMGGQLAIHLPEEDLLVVTTADTIGLQGGNQLIYNALYDHIVRPLRANKAQVLERHVLPPIRPIGVIGSLHNEDLMEKSKSLTFKALKSQPIPLNFCRDLPTVPLELEENDHAFKGILLRFDADYKNGVLTLYKNQTPLAFEFGISHLRVGSTPIYHHRCLTSGAFLDHKTFYIKCHLVDEALGSLHFQVTLKDQRVNLYMKKIEESFYDEFEGYLTSLPW